MDEVRINRAIVKIKPGLQKYLNISNMINKVNVSENEEFQKAFNGFYRVRQRPKGFYEKFYTFMEENKENSPSFEKTLLYIYEELGRVEASFSSKLVATINPSLPIWDTVVLTNLGLKAPPYYKKNRIVETISLYNEIIEWHSNFLEKEEARNLIGLFDREYPNTGISNIKKIDFILWQIRD